MKQKSIFLFFSLFFFSPLSGLYAQGILTLEQAVKIALENNYDIKLTANDLEISKNNVSRANAGMLPVVTGSLTNNNRIENGKQVTSTGQVQERNNAKNTSLNYGVNLNWRIFDGFQMFARYDQLKEFQKLDEANLRSAVITTVSEVINSYYDLVQLQQQLTASKTTLDISHLRMQTAQNRFEIGKAARLEVLAANVDLNTDTTSMLRQRNLYRNAQIHLNEILARDVNTQFTVIEIITIDNTLNLNQLSAFSAQQNPLLQAALINQKITELNLKQVKAGRYPVVGLNTGYIINSSRSALGFAQRSSGQGFSYGLSASINIFNGFLQKRDEKNAALELDNAKLDYAKLNQNINAQLASVYQTYITNLELVKLEEANQLIARQNLDITLEKFRLGTIAPVEFREAQRNYVDASLRYTNAQYLAKIAEISLKEISGMLNLQ